MRFARNNRRRGQTLVEFALILPIFLLMMLGILDLGRAVYAYHTINNAAREAVRVAIVDQNTTVIQDEAVQQSVGLGVSTGDVDVTFLDGSYANTAPCNATPRMGCVAEIEVAYTYRAVTPIIGQIVGEIQMIGSTRQPIERTYESAP